MVYIFAEGTCVEAYLMRLWCCSSDGIKELAALEAAAVAFYTFQML